MSKRILFITTLNLATNPRLVKEIELAVNNGFEVEVMSFTFPKSHWSSAYNLIIMQKYPSVRFINIPAGRENIFNWLLSVYFERLFRFASILLPLKDKHLSYASTRRSYLILKNLNKVSQADIVIGHNLGAIYPTLFYTQRLKATCGFDMEDYHPGEGNDVRLQKLTLTLMQRILPSFGYITYASESMMKHCKAKISSIEDVHSKVILNSFSQHEFSCPKINSSHKLQLVWFSQQIDIGRGLEKIIPIVNKHHENIHLTLFGNCNDSFHRNYLHDVAGVTIAGTMSQTELHSQLSNYDVGLAIEPGKDLNNQMALSNKLLAYVQSGLFVLATDTIEQKRFMTSYPQLGLLINKDFSELEKVLMSIYQNLTIIRENRLARFEANKNFSWENVNNDLLNIWAL